MLGTMNSRLGPILSLGLLINCLACSAGPTPEPEERLRSNLIKIVSPEDGFIVEPGSTFRVVVELAPGSPFREVALDTGGFVFDREPLSRPPYEFLLTALRDEIGPQQITARGVVAPGNTASSEPITVDIETDEPAAELHLLFRSRTFMYPGDVDFLRVHEVLPDRRWRNLNNSTRIFFQSNDEAVATVSPTGKITATGTGNTTVILRYQELERVIPVSVRYKVDGDLSGNGMVCMDDLNTILTYTDIDPRYPASGPFDARDRNKDGVITTADAELLRKLCTYPDCSCIPPKKE